MRTTNKLKLVMVFILLYMAIILTVQTANAQGGPWGPPGGNGPGPPSPPGNYCEQFPNDPACANTSVPVGSPESMALFAFLAGTFFMYRLYKKQGVTNDA